jgi:hypothetical protein
VEYTSSGYTETLASLKTYIEILNELGIAYRSVVMMKSKKQKMLFTKV